MEFLAEYWYLILAAIVVVGYGGFFLYRFLKKPTSEQMKDLKEWLLWAVTEAEKKLGSGTGELKLRFVYDMFVEKFSFLAKVISFDTISKLVDEALEEMKKLLEENEAVKTYIVGTEEENKEE